MEIIITKTAKKNANKIIDYLRLNYGNIVAKDFIYKIEKTLEIIEQHPTIWMVYKKNIKSLVIIKQITVYYRVEENKIFI